LSQRVKLWLEKGRLCEKFFDVEQARDPAESLSSASWHDEFASARQSLSQRMGEEVYGWAVQPAKNVQTKGAGGSSTSCTQGLQSLEGGQTQ